MNVYRGHLPNVDGHTGDDLLLMVQPDGVHKLLTRPGAGQSTEPWSYAGALTPHPARDLAPQGRIR